MSIRQVRLSDPKQIRARILEFQDKKINVVLIDGNVFLGTLTSVSETNINITNMRLKKLSIAFDQINELYFDILA